MTMIEKMAAAMEIVNEQSRGLRYTELMQAMAKAALEAMKEPTEKMKTAFYQTYNQSTRIGPFDESWKALIEAALSEPPSPQEGLRRSRK